MAEAYTGGNLPSPFTVDQTARDAAAGAAKSVSFQDYKQRILRLASRGAVTYRSDNAGVIGGPVNGLLPMAGPAIITNWTASENISINSAPAFRYFGNLIAKAISAGTNGAGGVCGSTQPIPGAYTVDGTVVWQVVGFRQPVAYANSLPLVADQLVYNGGKVFKVTVAGTTASSGTGPTTAALTDGGVTFAYVGEQVLPLVTYVTTLSGLSQLVDYDGTGDAGAINKAQLGATVLSGTAVRDGSNGFGKIGATSTDGAALTINTVTGSMGSHMTNFIGVRGAVQMFANTDNSIWADGVLASFAVHATANTNTYVVFDFTGVAGGSYKQHEMRFDLNVGARIVGWYGAVTDLYLPYSSPDNLKLIISGESFIQGAGGSGSSMGMGNIEARALGFADFPTDCQGGTGILAVNGSSVSYTGRYNVGVKRNIGPNGTVHIIHLTQNDTGGSGVSGNKFTSADLKAAIDAYVAQDIANGIYPILVAPWGAVGPASAAGTPAAQLVTDGAAVAVKYGIPYIDQSNLLSSGGYAGAANFSSGNSAIFTQFDQTHPSPYGHLYRGLFNAQQIVNAISKQAA